MSPETMVVQWSLGNGKAGRMPGKGGASKGWTGGLGSGFLQHGRISPGYSSVVRFTSARLAQVVPVHNNE